MHSDSKSVVVRRQGSENCAKVIRERERLRLSLFVLARTAEITKREKEQQGKLGDRSA
jgi:hypothetical protein